MQARIYQPTKTAMQSGKNNTHHWLIEFPNPDSKYTEATMNWTASSDTKHQVRLKFSTQEAAISYAKLNNIDYEITEPQAKKFIKRAYADNFI